MRHPLYLCFFLLLVLSLTSFLSPSYSLGNSASSPLKQKERGQASTSTPTSTFKALSYNLALTDILPVGSKAERLPLILDFLKKQETDLICLQEVWSPEDRKKILQALEGTFPHAFYSLPKPAYIDKAPACGLGDLFGKHKPLSCTLNQCLFNKKKDEEESLGQCVSKHCYPTLENLITENKACALALQAQANRPISSILFKLLWPFKTKQRASILLYGGENGLLLLSKEPFIQKEERNFPSSLIRRSGLQVEIQRGKNKMGFWCTHLAADITDVAPYASMKFPSPKREHDTQVSELLKWVKEKPHLPTLLMGDFNCSLENPEMGISDSFASACKRFTMEQNLMDVGVHFSLPCTFCSGKGNRAYQLDRFYLSSDIQPLTARVLRPQLQKAGATEKSLSFLSDHHPIELEIPFSF